MASNFGTVNSYPAQVQTVPVVAAPVVYTVPPEQRAQQHVNIYKGLGVTQAVLGILSILLAVIAVIVVSVNRWDGAYGTTYICSGIWCGVFFVVAGVLGWSSSKQPDPCKINLTMAFSIVASVLSFIMLSIEAAAASYSSFSNASIYPVHVMLVLIALIEFVVSIVHSAYCCAATCCYSSGVAYSTNTIITTTTTQAPHPGQFQPGAPMNVPPQPYQGGYYQQVSQPPSGKVDMSNQPAVNQYYPSQPGYGPTSSAPAMPPQPQMCATPYPSNPVEPPPYKE